MISRPGEPLVGIDNLIKSRTYSVLGEVDYERTWENSRVTAGIRHTQSWITNDYVEQGIDDHMNQGNSYIFGEYWMRLGKHFDFSAGIGYSLYSYAPPVDGSPTPTPFGAPGSRPDIPSTTILPYDSTLSAWAA